MKHFDLLCLGFALLSCVIADKSKTRYNQGSFSNPAAHQRPRFRYWVPDASVSTDIVASDIRGAGSIGAGGVELLGFYNYGGSFGPPPNGSGIDWTVTGWGLPAWKNLQDVAIRTAVNANLVIDLSLGPNQGAGTPAPYNDTGRAWQLVSRNVTLTAGQHFEGELPGWGMGELLAATVGLVVTNESITQVTPNGFVGTTELPGYRVTLDVDSGRDYSRSQLLWEDEPDDACNPYQCYVRPLRLLPEPAGAVQYTSIQLKSSNRLCQERLLGG